MRSISFNEPGEFDKILKGEIMMTIRGIYIPMISEGDIVVLKERGGEWNEKRVWRQVTAKISLIRPFRLKEVNDAVAHYQGFKDATEMKNWLSEKYKTTDGNRWFFAICWNKIYRDQAFLEDYLARPEAIKTKIKKKAKKTEPKNEDFVEIENQILSDDIKKTREDEKHE